MKKRYFLAIIITINILLFISMIFVLTNPVFGKIENSINTFDSRLPSALQDHVQYLSELKPERYFVFEDGMNAAAEYIYNELEKSGCTPSYQEFIADFKDHRNVICSFNKEQNNIITLGAHYDVEGEKPGADDNASGVAGIIEVAKILGDNVDILDSSVRYDIVAFTLEEPPYFGTKKMGSNQYVQDILSRGNTIHYSINLEMIGYFSDNSGSQLFPIPDIDRLYGDVGDFIAVVGRVRDFGLTKSMKKSLLPHLKTKSLNAPVIFPGISLSDHINFRAEGINAIMITDTGFYRNENYHTMYDTYEKLDYEKMSQIVLGVSKFILHE